MLGVGLAAPEDDDLGLATLGVAVDDLGFDRLGVQVERLLEQVLGSRTVVRLQGQDQVRLQSRFPDLDFRCVEERYPLLPAQLGAIVLLGEGVCGGGEGDQGAADQIGGIVRVAHRSSSLRETLPQ